jgi:chorismate-pyruvate lyase
MSAIDTLGNLNVLGISSLPPLQRILLITDGTLTEILEAYFCERISLVKLSQRVIAATTSDTLLDPIPGESLIERKILLQGERTGTNYVYAESLVAVDRLPSAFREGLNSHTPLGRLWLEHRLETFKQMHEVHCQPADGLCHYFEHAEPEPLLVRTYRVLSGGRVVMVISEYFPVAYRESLPVAEDEHKLLAGAAR